MLDEKALAALQSLSDPSDKEDFLTSLIDIFSRDLPIILSELEIAVRGRNYKAIMSIAHRLKGNTLELGAPSCFKLCEMLEKIGRDKIDSDLDALYKDLSQNCLEVAEELQTRWRKVS